MTASRQREIPKDMGPSPNLDGKESSRTPGYINWAVLQLQDRYLPTVVRGGGGINRVKHNTEENAPDMKNAGEFMICVYINTVLI